MIAVRDEIGARVDALALAHEGDDFVTAVRDLADELDDEGKAALQQVLLERAADEEDFQKAVRQRFAEKGWTRRTLAKLERRWRDDRSDTIAAALKAGEDDEVERELSTLRREPGRAALVFDELSRHESPRVRAWVPAVAEDVLGDGGRRLILSLTRDRDPAVRDAAVEALFELGPEAAAPLAPDLRRRLQSSEPRERIAATWGLAALGDTSSVRVLAQRAETADTETEKSVARAAVLVLNDDEASVAEGLRRHAHDDVPALAVAARMLGTDLTIGALREAASSAPDEECRAACAAELDQIRDET
ncbi:MAG TPA: HEAT repeat domain-containing protein [Gaiellaceae bacterium]|nr:HEAT repeat domain-containing protein [Gaiellaceae bacterium]